MLSLTVEKEKEEPPQLVKDPRKFQSSHGMDMEFTRDQEESVEASMEYDRGDSPLSRLSAPSNDAAAGGVVAVEDPSVAATATATATTTTTMKSSHKSHKQKSKHHHLSPKLIGDHHEIETNRNLSMTHTKRTHQNASSSSSSSSFSAGDLKDKRRHFYIPSSKNAYSQSNFFLNFILILQEISFLILIK